jgi:hypothetical protein
MTESKKQSLRSKSLSEQTLAISHRRKVILKALISDDPAKRLEAKNEIILNYPKLIDLTVDSIEQDNGPNTSKYVISLLFLLFYLISGYVV